LDSTLSFLFKKASDVIKTPQEIDPLKKLLLTFSIQFLMKIFLIKIHLKIFMKCFITTGVLIIIILDKIIRNYEK
jgi:hypothetical protein